MEHKENYFVARRKKDIQAFWGYLSEEMNKDDTVTIRFLLARYAIRSGYTTNILNKWLQELVDAKFIILKDKERIDRVL